MIPLLQAAMRCMYRTLIRGASLLAPAHNRAEWSQEWQAELWYLLREHSSRVNLDLSSIREAIAFCLGAYKDAFWLQKDPGKGSRSGCDSNHCTEFLDRPLRAFLCSRRYSSSRVESRVSRPSSQ